MHREGRHRDEIFARRGFALQHAVFVCYDPSRDFHRSVEKAVINSAAVRFGVELRIGPCEGDCVFLELQRGRVGMRRDDLKEKIVQRADGKGDETAPVSFHEIFSALLDRPVVRFAQSDKPVSQKKLFCVFHRVIGGVRGFQKIQKTIYHDRIPFNDIFFHYCSIL